MSELKEHLFCECDECIREYRGPLSNEMRPYYLKSEADKVIAHQKYKRCLAMAKIAQDDWHLHNSFYAMGHQEFEKRKCKFYEKWHKRWLELAEHYKESK